MTSTCDLWDELEDAGTPPEVAVLAWRSYGGHAAFDGLAQTVRCHGDNTHVRAQLETAGEGRVLVVDGGGSLEHALCGDRVAQLAVDHGWAGLVIAGAVRDTDAIEQMPIGLVALGAVPRRSRKEGAGVVGGEVRIGGARIRPGDRVVVDADGVLVVPAQ